MGVEFKDGSVGTGRQSKSLAIQPLSFCFHANWAMAMGRDVRRAWGWNLLPLAGDVFALWFKWHNFKARPVHSAPKDPESSYTPERN
jgi:hypothetical protein